MSEFSPLPMNLPVPIDDGAAAHLPGSRIPSVRLAATPAGEIDLASLAGCSVVFAFPRSGRDGEPALVPDWDAIPGARGCNRQACAFRDLNQSFNALRASIFGLSTQTVEDQREVAERYQLPFPLLSDGALSFSRSMRLPTFDVAGKTLLKRLTLVIIGGRVVHVFYPVFPPDRATNDVLVWLREHPVES